MQQSRPLPLLSRGACALLAALCLAAAPTLSGQPVANFNWDGVPLGSPVPTTTPGVDPYPQSTIYSVGGFPDSGPVTGTAVVQNYLSLSNAAIMSTTQGGTGAFFMDTQMLFPGSAFRFSFDIAVITTPTSGLPQAGVGAPNGQAFAINVFGLDIQRYLRFAVAPNGAGGGDFAYRLPGAAGDLQSFGSYLNGEIHHIDIVADLFAGEVSIDLDGARVVTGAALVSATPSTGLSEVFMFQNGVEGQLNQIALDNVQITAIPEPASYAAGVGALACAVWFARRRRTMA